MTVAKAWGLAATAATVSAGWHLTECRGPIPPPPRGNGGKTLSDLLRLTGCYQHMLSFERPHVFPCHSQDLSIPRNMSHPDCVLTKQAHFLEHTLEWRLFDAVQPLFASVTLPWRLGGDNLSLAIDVAMPATAVGSPEDARRINLADAFDFFLEELQRLPDSGPDRAIDCGAFDHCRGYLAEVLDLLNEYVKESVLEAARTLPSAKDTLALPSDRNDDQVCPVFLGFFGLQCPTSRRCCVTSMTGKQLLFRVVLAEALLTPCPPYLGVE